MVTTWPGRLNDRRVAARLSAATESGQRRSGAIASHRMPFILQEFFAMATRSLVIAAALAATVTAAAAQQAASAPAAASSASVAKAASAPALSASAAAAAAREVELTKLLDEASKLIGARKPQDALVPLDKVIAAYEAQYQGVKFRVFGARSETEAAAYLDQARKDGVDAAVVSPNWAYAYSMKAYALVDLHRLPEARALLEKALKLAPKNARVLTELGTIYQIEKDWAHAEKSFSDAVDAARAFSPPALRKAEMAGALRGVGYVFIEQGRLDDAEKMFKECIRIDGNDAAAKKELDYIGKLRDKKAAKPS
jgi:tetratricopeptide (TPR) repeat protein